MNAPSHPPASSGDDQLSHAVIGAAMVVHRALGPGLLESVYHECLRIELEEQRIPFESEIAVPIVYRGRTIKAFHRLDLLVAGSLIVELKAVEALTKVHEAQVLTYLRLTGHRRALLINFNTALLKDGVKRLVL